MEDDETSLDLYEDLDKFFCSTRSVPECSLSYVEVSGNNKYTDQ